MFLWQKLGYEYTNITCTEDFDDMMSKLKKAAPEIVTFDTETTGLNFMIDLPFLFAISFKASQYDRKFSYTIILDDTNGWMIKELYKQLSNVGYVFAHNTKYDYHMMINGNLPIPEDVQLADGMTVARLTEYADGLGGIGLEILGTKYVDPNAKFAGKAIKEIINKLNKERLNSMKKILKEELPKGIKMMDVVNSWRKRVAFVDNPYQEYFHIIEANYTEPNYYDAYVYNPALMLSYAVDDTVILLEYLEKALPVLKKTQGLDGVFKQECELIRVVGDFERNGFKANISYLIESRDRVKKYIEKRYKELWDLTKKEFSSGQHKVIMQLMKDKYDINMLKCDMQSLQEIVDGVAKSLKKPNFKYNSISRNEKGEWYYAERIYSYFDDKIIGLRDKKLIAPVEYEEVCNIEAGEVAKGIIELRTLDKWLSTYIEGMMNRVVNGRIHSSINNSGAVTGRVSSDLQQQPKEALLDIDGNELFHPRRVAVNDDGGEMYFFDFSQMELRLQADYTVELSGGDFNLCRAFIPYECQSFVTGAKYSIENDYDNWNSGEWVDEEGNSWTPTDLHTVTTLKAFPKVKVTDDDFGHYRRLGKMCNFLKNYGGGIDAIKSQLHVEEKIAYNLNMGYYQAFPKILDYQRWVEDELTKYGYIPNIYNRKYYIQDNRFFYKAYNYVIQGGCADIVKEKQIMIARLLEEKKAKSKMILPVHDEIILWIANDEKWLIPLIKAIMEYTRHVMEHIPMICDVEVTHTSWADKVEVEL